MACLMAIAFVGICDRSVWKSGRLPSLGQQLIPVPIGGLSVEPPLEQSLLVRPATCRFENNYVESQRLASKSQGLDDVMLGEDIPQGVTPHASVTYGKQPSRCAPLVSESPVTGDRTRVGRDSGLARRPLERSATSTMALRKREDLAFHFDPTVFPAGLRIANESGQPAIISLHGPTASQFTINGVQAEENVPYSMAQDLEIQGPATVGVHIRSGSGIIPVGPAGNG